MRALALVVATACASGPRAPSGIGMGVHDLLSTLPEATELVVAGDSARLLADPDLAPLLDRTLPDSLDASRLAPACMQARRHFQYVMIGGAIEPQFELRGWLSGVAYAEWQPCLQDAHVREMLADRLNVRLDFQGNDTLLMRGDKGNAGVTWLGAKRAYMSVAVGGPTPDRDRLRALAAPGAGKGALANRKLVDLVDHIDPDSPAWLVVGETGFEKRMTGAAIWLVLGDDYEVRFRIVGRSADDAKELLEAVRKLEIDPKLPKVSAGQSGAVITGELHVPRAYLRAALAKMH
jgi:hypothetical protein